MQAIQTKTKENKLEVRPPIVVVMGHIDHGKTTILDWYRKSAVAAGEAGGITQHIGAYEVDYEGRNITFIDTPGHEAFTKIRSRGAMFADIAIIVIAADEGVKQQTKEALAIAQEHHLPFIVALNKIDKAEANPERVKQELANEGVLVESYGGKVPSTEISAKTGQRMEDLLETVHLLAELEELKANPEKSAQGVVLETHRDPRRGITATLLVRDGTLKRTDILVIGRSAGTIKILEDFRGRAVLETHPSSPAIIAGLSEVPLVGEAFRAFDSRGEAQHYLASLPPPAAVHQKPMFQPDEGKTIFNIILKTDMVGSKEAIEDALLKLESDKMELRLLRSEVGNINEDDVNMALATRNVTIIGFKVRLDAAARELARTSNVKIIVGDVIYRLLDDVKAHAADILPPIVQRSDAGRVKILKLFKKEGNKQIIGGKIESGILKRGAQIEVIRNKEVIGAGRITQLQRGKAEAEEIAEGNECGIMADADITIREGDVLAAFTEEKIKQTL